MTDPKTTVSVPPSPPRSQHGAKLWLQGAFIVAVTAGVTGLLVHVQDQQTYNAKVAEMDAALAASFAERDALEAHIGALEQLDRLKVSRTAIYAAMGELDRRNFGSAQAKVEQSVAALGSWMQHDADKVIAGVAYDLSEFTVTVQPDLGEQRDALAVLGARIDPVMQDRITRIPMRDVPVTQNPIAHAEGAEPPAH